MLDLELARKAVEANRQGNYFVTNDSEIYDKYREQAEQDKNKEPEERKVLRNIKANIS